MKQITFWLSLLFSLYTPAIYGAISVQTSLSSSTLYLGDEINLQLKVDGAQQGIQLKFPEIKGLSFRQLGSPSRSSQTTIINGKVETFRGVVYNIGISATQRGSFSIPGITVIHQSKEYKGKAFKISVKAPGQQSAMKLKTTVSKSRLYLQQPLQITLKWYIQDDVNDYNFRFPLVERKDELQLELIEQKNSAGTSTQINVSGLKIPFWQSNEPLNGKEYSVFTTTLRIYPQSVGDLVIPAASVKAKIKVGTTVQRDFFDRMVRVPKLKTVFATSVKQVVKILEPPFQNRPASYTGAIGQFDIQLLTSVVRVKVGDPIELKIKIFGNGQLHNIAAPLISEIESYRKNFVIIDNLQPGDIQGNSIVFTQIVRARDSNVKEIPAVEFTYFNPVDEKYHSLKSNHLPIKVLATRRVKTADIIVNTEKQPSEGEVGFKEIKQGIRGNYTFSDALETQKRSWLWLVALLLPPGMYFALLIVVNRNRKLAGDNALLRSRSAKGLKNRKLKKAEKLLNQGGAEFYLELSRSVSGFISDRLNLGKGEFTMIELKNLEEENLLPKELVQELIDQMEEFDRYRFLNLDADLEGRTQILKNVQNLIKKVEKSL